MTTNRMSEEFESTFVPTVQRDYPREFEEDSFDDPKGYTDEQLVAAAQKGVARALGELLMRHRKFLFKTLRRMTDTIEEAEDIVQEAMIRACAGIGGFRRAARFSTWLFVIATNCLRSERRRSRPTQWIYLDDTEIGSYQYLPFDLQDSRPTPEQECAGREFLERAHREMQRLPELYRSALQAQGVSERASADTARDLGITRATFNTRLRKGRIQLAQAMGRNLRGRVGGGRARREI
jgi:RNA polymerase sigma-70 factor (ECF subfamily)